MKVSARIITNTEELSEDENDLDVFLKEYGENPFMQLPFIRNAMDRNASITHIPAIVIVRVDGEIVGLAPLILRRNLGIRYARFLTEYWASPNFVIKENYESMTMETVLHLVLKRLNSKLIVLDLNSDSPNLRGLKRICVSNNIPFFEQSHQFMDHGVISVSCSWDDYKKLCGRHFRRKLRQIENKMNKGGKWKLTVIENNNEYSEEAIYDKILAIEKLSWKEKIRQGQTVDDSIIWFLKSSSSTNNNTIIIKRKIWFLELNNQPVAYAMILQYKGTAYMAKTSFAEEYRELSLGKFVMYAAIKDLFDKKEVQKIDFLTYLPIVEFWRANCLKRVRIILGSGIFVKQEYAKSIFRTAVARLNHDNRREYYMPTARTQLNEDKRKSIFHLP
ncbi:MAG: GNAT family N-acetyltransferase [Nitrososphaeria archaeon]|jgi:hypothetical protein